MHASPTTQEVVKNFLEKKPVATPTKNTRVPYKHGSKKDLPLFTRKALDYNHFVARTISNNFSIAPPQVNFFSPKNHLNYYTISFTNFENAEWFNAFLEKQKIGRASRWGFEKKKMYEETKYLYPHYTPVLVYSLFILRDQMKNIIEILAPK